MNWLEKRIAPVPDTDDDDTIQLAIMCLQHVRPLAAVTFSTQLSALTDPMQLGGLTF